MRTPLLQRRPDAESAIRVRRHQAMDGSPSRDATKLPRADVILESDLWRGFSNARRTSGIMMRLSLNRMTLALQGCFVNNTKRHSSEVCGPFKRHYTTLMLKAGRPSSEDLCT